MRIATRLWIALLFVIVAVLGVGVFTRVRHEQRLLLEVTLRDRRFFAVVLQTALARRSGDGDPLAEARELLRREEIAEAHVSTRLVALPSNGDPSLPQPQLPASDIAPLARGEVVVGVFGDELITYVPLVPRHAALELVEPHAVDSLLARVGWQSLWSQAVALAALAGVVTFVLTRWLVGRPLERLTVLARQIGGGDFSARASVPHGKHEVAFLVREMNGMAERLGTARRALDELDAERVAALEQLRHADRLRTVGQLASALAHELGTPLNVVSGHARLIEQEPRVSPDAHASARTILEQTSRMTGILKDLLGFARRTGKRAEVIDLRALARHAARTLEPLTRRDRANIRIDADQEPVNVNADAQQLLQVLTNLLTNAMQAMPEGGNIDVTVDSLDTEPPLGVHGPKGRYARIAVIDQGVGIEADDLPHLFEPFFTRKSEGEGTGLGLAVVEGIAKDHRGWVEVQSERGRGSRFEVYLPASGTGQLPAPDALSSRVER
ncbi:MAG: Sensory box histidine kinase/response regulator [Myxococcaceae bacterium]|nr:Sensory box histidine kinase/response regulator [Myxococcaceae bacterium]